MTICMLPDQEDKLKLDAEETAEEKTKRIGLPTYDVAQLLKELQLEGTLAKMEEHEINSELFWDLGDGDLSGMLDIKLIGQRKKLVKRMAEIKAAHEKAMELKHKESKKLDTTGIQDMLDLNG
jgi:hypothetical protein